MYKKFLATSLVAASLLLVGCGEQETNCRFDVQDSLDTGDFDRAISQLDGECATAYSESDRYFNLAAAYMGKSGFGAIDVVNMLLDAGDSEDDAFATFTRSVSENQHDESLALLNQAQTYFLQSIYPDRNVSTLTTAICDENADVNDSRIENACFYIGFNQTIQATATISYLTNDVDTFVDALNDVNNTQTPLDMEVSVDALAWATGASEIPNNSTITPSAVTIEGQDFIHLDITNNGHTYYRLASSNAPSSEASTVLTDGYCDVDGNKTACEGIENNVTGEIINTSLACYACPVSIDGNSSQSVAELLVDTLNGGTDAIVSVSDDEDIQESVDDFIREVKGLPDNTDVSDVNVTVEDIIQYLNDDQN